MKRCYGKIGFLAIVSILVFAVAMPCWAEEKPLDKAKTDVKPKRTKGSELTEEKIEKMMTRLKEADPEEAKRLEGLRKENPEKFKAELKQATMKCMHEKTRKHMKQGPRSEHFGKGPMMKGAGRGGFGGRQARHFKQDAEEYLEWLKENYPEEAAELEKAKEDPGRYHRRLGLSMRKYGRIARASKDNPELAAVLKESMELRKQRDEVLKKIQSAQGDQKEALTKELTQIVDRNFDLLIKRKQIRHQEMLERLKKLEEEVKQNEAEVEKWKTQKQQKVQERVQQLISKGDKFKWD